MAVSISAVLLLGIMAVFLIRKAALRPLHAVVCALLGFYLAGTSLAPSIRDAGTSFAGLVNGIHF
ncbi:DUF2304 domain-containing protein [Yinghuangia seranimata]|uniref:DUF2304 domain-containing protein n=1 Tax=Yinghuangia seranimata TaxID=408067 RepID=UPI00248BFF70|nr:DUF2304 domain-containing protein [Yinghuangia seranimata]MDI2128924.1 DUF2304 domain-containing protein [Yinghuangia seranimata]